MGICCGKYDSGTVKFTSYAERKIQFGLLLPYGKLMISEYLRIPELHAGTSLSVSHANIYNLRLYTNFDIVASIDVHGLLLKLKLDPCTLLYCDEVKFGYGQAQGGLHYFTACLCREGSDHMDWVMVTTKDGIRYSFYTRTNLGHWRVSDEVAALQALQDVRTPKERVSAPSMPPETTSAPPSLSPPAIEVMFLDSGTCSTTSPAQPSTVVTPEPGGSRATGPTNPDSQPTKHEHRVPFQVAGLAETMKKGTMSDVLAKNHQLKFEHAN